MICAARVRPAPTGSPPAARRLGAAGGHCGGCGPAGRAFARDAAYRRCPAIHVVLAMPLTLPSCRLRLALSLSPPEPRPASPMLLHAGTLDAGRGGEGGPGWDRKAAPHTSSQPITYENARSHIHIAITSMTSRCAANINVCAIAGAGTCTGAGAGAGGPKRGRGAPARDAGAALVLDVDVCRARRDRAPPIHPINNGKDTNTYIHKHMLKLCTNIHRHIRHPSTQPNKLPTDYLKYTP